MFARHAGRARHRIDDGGWSYFSKWVGEAGLAPFVFCGIGAIVFLLGVYWLMTVVVPPLAGGGPLARFGRIALLAIFGAALVTAAGGVGFVRLGGDQAVRAGARPSISLDMTG